MKKSWMLYLCAILLALDSNFQVHAMAGDLNHPSIALPADAPQKFREQIMAILNDKDCKFLGGHFINANTTLQYGGSAEALSRMLAQLAECDGIRVQVTFVKKPGGEVWTLNHNAWADPGHIAVQVNLVSPINLEHLDISAFGKTSEVGHQH
jgi:hypothetical protein